MRTNPGLAEISFLSDYIRPVFKHAQAQQREPHFRRIAVVHTDQRGGTSAASLRDMTFVDDDDLSRVPLGKVERDGRAHYTGAENYDVGGGCPGAVPRTGSGIGGHVEEVLGDLSTKLGTLKINRQFSVASSRISVMRRPLSAGLFSSHAVPGGLRCARELR
jgi:hypothetical protein